MSHPLSLPDRLAKQGKSAYQRADYTSAAEVFQSAATAYQSAEESLLAAEMSNNASVAWLKADRPEDALQVVLGTEVVFSQAGDWKRAGMAFGNMGAALEALGRLEEALSAYEQSAELLKQAGDSETRLYVMQAISALQLQTGKQLQALATMQAGLDGVARPSAKQRMLKKLLDLPSRLMR